MLHPPTYPSRSPHLASVPRILFAALPSLFCNVRPPLSLSPSPGRALWDEGGRERAREREREERKAGRREGPGSAEHQCHRSSRLVQSACQDPGGVSSCRRLPPRAPHNPLTSEHPLIDTNRSGFPLISSGSLRRHSSPLQRGRGGGCGRGVGGSRVRASDFLAA